MAKLILSKYIKPDVLTRVEQYKLMPRGLVEGTLAGAHKSPFHGFSVEFAGHREYVRGDDLRHLDWNVYYRHQRHVIKQYEMETNLICHLVLDISASMRYGEGDEQKLLYASRMAVTLGYLVIEGADKVSLTVFDEQVRESLRPSNTMGQIINMTEELDRVEPRKKTKIGPSLLDVAGRAGRRGIIVIMSDFFVDLDDLEEGLQRLRYDRHEVVLMQTLHHDEVAFDIAGMVKFVGLESDDEFLTRPEDIKQAYLQALNSFNDRLTQICDDNQCERILCDTSASMAQLFANYLEQRTLVRRR